MARRDIRRMLMTPKRQIKDRPWAVPALMALVLVAGLGLGLGIGMLSGNGSTEYQQDETVLDRPPRPVEEAVPQLPDPQAGLLTPVPRARPGGAADEFRAPEPTPEPELAAIPPAPIPEPSVLKGLPAWKIHAVPAPRMDGRPMIAIVIDDMGIDKRRTARVSALPGPLTLSWLTYAEDLKAQTQAARRGGHEMMLHVPMEPMGEKYDPGPDVLEVKLSAEEIMRRLTWGLDRFDGYVGINNHMGSRFTAHAPGMEVVMRELGRRGLLFMDSVTTQKSVAPAIAQRHGIAFAARNVFLDNERDLQAVRTQLGKLEAHARKHGAAIAIGHPYDETIQALAGWLPGLASRGFVLVPVSTIVAARH